MPSLKALCLLTLASFSLISAATAGAFKYRNTPGDMNWTNGRVPYVFNDDVAADKRLVFQRSARAWQRFGNLRFVPTTQNIIHQSPDGDFLLVQTNDLRFLDWVKDVNYAWIGRSGGMQPMSIHNWWDETVVHELGHTLGFVHEQMRLDRDNFVQMNYDLINGFTTINFNKEPHSTNLTAYDYDSIMHYHSEAFRDSWKTGNTVVATAVPEKTHTIGRNAEFPPHPEEYDIDSVGEITQLFSDGDRSSIRQIYGQPTNFVGIITLPNNTPLNDVKVVLQANGTSMDEQAFVDLMAVTEEKTAHSDVNGKVFFRGIPSGQFKVVLSKTGYSFSESTYNFSGGSEPFEHTREFTATNTESQPPVVAVTNPLNRAFWKLPQAITGNASDVGAAGMKQVEVVLSKGGVRWNWAASRLENGGDAEASLVKVIPMSANGAWTIPVDNFTAFTGLPEGVYELKVRGVDLSNNSSAWETTTFTYDKTKPVLALDAPAPGATFFDFETLPLGGTVSDTVDAESIVTFRLCEENPGSFSRYWTGSRWTTDANDSAVHLPARVSAGRWQPLSLSSLPPRAMLHEGQFSIRVSGADHAGNVADAVNSTMLTRSPVDTTFPEIAVLPSFDGARYATHELPSLTGTASDPESFVQGVRLYLMRLVPGMNGTSNTFKYWTGEEWSDSEGHLESEYNPVAKTWFAPGQDYRLPAGAEELPDGTYKLQVTAFNRESPQMTRLIEETFHIASAPPTLSLTGPTQNGFVKAGWSITGAVTDPSGTGYENDRVSFTFFDSATGKYWNGSQWVTGQVELHAPIVNNAWTYPGTTGEALPQGESTYALSAYVTDRNGNVSSPVAGGQPGNNNIVFKVDTTPPTCVIASPANNTVITVPPLLPAIFHGTATDASGQPQVTLFLRRTDGSYFSYWSGSRWDTLYAGTTLPGIYTGGPSSSAWSFNTPFPCLNQFDWGMKNGTYTLIAIARDVAGNETPREVSLIIDYNPVWLRTQDQLVSPQPDQIPPIPVANVGSAQVYNGNPWANGQPGNQNRVSPIAFQTDSQGHYYLVNSVSDEYHAPGKNFDISHGVIQRLGAGGWRRQRTVFSTVEGTFPDEVTKYYEKWSPDGEAFLINAAEFRLASVSPAAFKTDAAGNTYAAFNLFEYIEYGASYGPELRGSGSALIVKFNAAGDVVWRTSTPGAGTSFDPPNGWLPYNGVRQLDPQPDGSVVVSMAGSNGESQNGPYFRQQTGLVRLAANGAVTSVARFGQREGYVEDTQVSPYIQSKWQRTAVDAAGNTYFMTEETTQGVSYSTQVLRKISPAGVVVKTITNSLCDAPQYWSGLSTDTDGNVYIVSTFQIAADDGRPAVTKYDPALNLVWRAFGLPKSVNLGENASYGVADMPYDLHVGPHGITLRQDAPGDPQSEFTRRHPVFSRFSAAGDLLWARAVVRPDHATTSGDDYANHMQVTSTGDVLFLASLGNNTLYPASTYGKISNAGDLQFYRPITEEEEAGYFWLSTLTPGDKIAAVFQRANSGFPLYGEEHVREFDNPASVTLAIALDANLPGDADLRTGDSLTLKVINRGSFPASYQWRKENAQGTPQNITGATGDSYVLANVALSAAGRYSCVVTKGASSVTSRRAVITVVQAVDLDIAMDTPGRTWTTGSTAPFTGFAPTPSHDGVDAVVSGPIGRGQSSYIRTTINGPATITFWYKTDLEDFQDQFDFDVDGENQPLAITDQNWSQHTFNVTGDGAHTLTWSLYRGSNTSDAETHKLWLDQFVVVGEMALATALDTSDLTFTTSSPGGWTGRASADAHDGVDMAVSGPIDDDETSWIETTVDGPGMVEFWWSVSCSTFDRLRVTVDGENYGSINGEQDWTKRTFPTMGAGPHTIRWSYVKNGDTAEYADSAYLDMVKFTPEGAGAAPVFTAQPASVLALAGTSASFTPSVTGGSGIGFQWQKGTTKKTSIPGASGPGYGFASVAAANVGVYSVIATNGVGRTTSNPAYLGLVTRAPTSVTVKEGGIVTLTAVATVPAGASITEYLWLKDGFPMSDSTTADGVVISGSGTKTLKLSKVMASITDIYTCQLRMTVAAAGSVPAHSVYGTNGNTDVVVVPKPVITPLAPRTFGVGQVVDVPVAAAHSPTKFSASGLPAGLAINALSGRITGKPTTASKIVKGLAVASQVKITATNVAGSTTVGPFPWTITALDPNIIGTYNGIVARQVNLNGLAGTDTGLGGTIKVTVASTGGLSGTLKLGSASIGLTGAVTVPDDVGNTTARIDIDRKSPLTDLVLTLTWNTSSGVLSGSVADTSSHSADFTAWRATVSAAYEGRHHAGLFKGNDLMGNGLYPQGNGYATLVVSKTGVVTWAGMLADKSTLTGSFPVGKNGEVPLHVLLYKGTGSVQGSVILNATTHFVDGSMSWYKAPQSASLSYKAGIPRHDLTVEGGLYVAANASLANLLDLTGNPPKAELTLTQAGVVASGPVGFSISTANKITLDTNTLGLGLKIAPATGLITGGFVQSGGRKPTMFGLVLPRSKQGTGFFLLSEPATSVLPISKTPVNSGLLDIRRAAPVN